MNIPKISPSLMCMDLLKLKDQIEFFNDKIGYYHVDIMDGHFVPNLTLSPFFVEQISKITKAPIDCHLMVTNPNMYIEPLSKSGANMITFHAEIANGQAFRLIDNIRRHGMAVGVVINPETRIQDVEIYLNRIDKITIMTVDPGFAGQPFIPEMLAKIKAFKKYKVDNNLHYEIEIDGSCNEKTFKSLLNAGADALIVGTSGLFSLDDDINLAWNKMIGQLHETRKEAVYA